MTDYIQVSTTTGDEENAGRIAGEMVNKRLAACVQVIGPITSTYWWKGKIEREKEWLCLMKTRRDLYEPLEKAIKAVHPYEEPEIIAVPIVEGSQGYLDWMDGEVGNKGTV